MTIKYRVFASNIIRVEVDSTESIRSITIDMGIPSKCRYRKIYEYIDFYVHTREYKCDGTGYLFSITDVL